MQARKSRAVNGGTLTSAITCTWLNSQFRHPVHMAESSVPPSWCTCLRQKRG
ncbi:hypothetical protein A2U01_0066166, partial [Trifolium medium]|nr:hypothetical protein [Trifolium medium]